MNPEIKQRIEKIKNGEVPEGYTNKYHIKPDSWQDEPLNMFFYKVKEKNHEKRYSTVFTNSAANGVIPQNEYFEKDIANEENIDGYYVVNVGDYIYNPRISEKAPYGPINQNLTGCTGIASPLYTVFSKKENVCICDDYIRYYLDSAEWNKYIYSVANYGARFDRMNISDSDFMNMPIALPQIEEQQKIAEILMQCDKLIELYQNETDELQKLKKICLCNMFPKNGNDVPEWRFPQFTDSWEQRKLGDLLQTLPFKQFLKEPEPDGKYEIIQQGNEPVIGFANGTPCGDYKDVVIFGDHTLSLYKPQHPFFVATDGVRIVKGQQDTDGYYLLSLLERYKPQSEGYKRYYIILADTNCITTYNTSEQEKIGVFFKLLDNLITLHQHKLEEMKKYKKSLMQLLLTGIVRVQA